MHTTRNAKLTSTENVYDKSGNVMENENIFINSFKYCNKTSKEINQR